MPVPGAVLTSSTASGSLRLSLSASTVLLLLIHIGRKKAKSSQEHLDFYNLWLNFTVGQTDQSDYASVLTWVVESSVSHLDHLGQNAQSTKLLQRV